MVEIDHLTFGARLRGYRMARRLTQERLASRAGFSRIYIALLEGGKRTPPPETVGLLAGALELGDADHAALAEAVACLTSPYAPPDAPAPPPLRLPPTPLVGRERDVAAVCALLGRGEARLLTVVGPGGVGKTRLALEAAGLHAPCADGVTVVSLAPLRDPTLVLPTIAQALGLRDRGARSARQDLEAYLRARCCWCSTIASKCWRRHPRWRSCWRRVHACASWPRAGWPYGCAGNRCTRYAPWRYQTRRGGPIPRRWPGFRRSRCSCSAPRPCDPTSR